jgi:hypothetical protein
MTKTDDRMSKIRMSHIFDSILDDLRDSQLKVPILHAVTRFPQIGTTLTIYDRFCAVQEVNDDGEIGFVALGHSVGDSLSHGLLELVDIRILDEEIPFAVGVKIFEGYTTNHKPHFTRDIVGIGDRHQIVGTILDCWKLASEIDACGGWQ